MNPFSSAVNQKLFLTKLLLSKLEPEQDKFGHVELALSQAALFQLMCAYRLYLNEIANNYKVPTQQRITDVKSLCDGLLAIDKHPSEAAEVRNLLDDSSSWLYAFFSAYQTIEEPQSLADESKQQLIPTQQLDSNTSGFGVGAKQVAHYLSCFSEMLERQRELMIEC